MDILFLETEASKLRINLLKIISSRSRLFQTYDFYNLVLGKGVSNAVESYLLEFASVYSDLISKVDLKGVDPAAIKGLLIQLSRINELYPRNENENISESLNILQEKYDYLMSVLEGNNESVSKTGLYLPLLEKGIVNFDGDYGLLSTISVQLKPKSDENKFHIIPGSGEPDAELKEQINNSLMNAVRIAGNYIKLKHSFWDIYIDFEEKSGEYSGSSFGMLLVVKLVEELLGLYDSPTKIFSFSTSALTGSVDKEGNIPSLSDDIISQKTKIVFYSDAEVFIIPEDDLQAAKETLSELNTAYPRRNLKLIGIQSIDDLFNLRNVVGIKKESGFLRTAKFIRKQAVSVVLLILLTVIIFFSGILDFDDNPDHFEYEGKVGFILNKNAKELYTTNLRFNYNNIYKKAYIDYSGKILDTNNDGLNEIILVANYQTLENINKNDLKINCYDHKLKELWNYKFSRTVSTIFETHTNTFDTFIFDTLTVNDSLFLFCLARNNPNEVSCVYRLNVRTGRNSNDILWHSGHLVAGKIYKFDSKNQLYALGMNNGFERSIIFSIDINNMHGQLPAQNQYELLNIPKANPDQYLLLPKTDYTGYYQMRFNIPQVGGIILDGNTDNIQIYILEGSDESNYVGIGYRFDKNLKIKSVTFSDALIEKRDALIETGKLKGPLTRTKEFEQSIISQLRYWDGEKFVTAEERFK